MYANLKVTIRQRNTDNTEVVDAWKVTTDPYSTTVYLDEPDHGGNRPVPAGKQKYMHGRYELTIDANY